jgi:hypothetical protein
MITIVHGDGVSKVVTAPASFVHSASWMELLIIELFIYLVRRRRISTKQFSLYSTTTHLVHTVEPKCKYCENSRAAYPQDTKNGSGK